MSSTAGVDSTKRVHVDGTTFEVSHRATVADLRGLPGRSWHPGRLHALDGTVISGTAAAPTVTIDGRIAHPDEVIAAEARVHIANTEDATEVAIPDVVPIEPQTGPHTWKTLWAPGPVGRRKVLRGETSGVVIPLDVISEPGAAISRQETGVAALTFDDGPDPTWTPIVLDILREKGVSATFFVLGSRAETYRGLIEREVAEGHSVQDHSWSHAPNFGSLNDDEVRSELLETARLIESITGRRPTFFRPPQGAMSPAIESMAIGNGFRIVLWNVDPQDWAGRNSDEIYAKVTNGLGGGDIILLHDGGGDRSATVAALPGIIDDLRSKGYQFVTLT